MHRRMSLSIFVGALFVGMVVTGCVRMRYESWEAGRTQVQDKGIGCVLQRNLCLNYFSPFSHNWNWFGYAQKDLGAEHWAVSVTRVEDSTADEFQVAIWQLPMNLKHDENSQCFDAPVVIDGTRCRSLVGCVTKPGMHILQTGEVIEVSGKEDAWKSLAGWRPEWAFRGQTGGIGEAYGVSDGNVFYWNDVQTEWVPVGIGGCKWLEWPKKHGFGIDLADDREFLVTKDGNWAIAVTRMFGADRGVEWTGHIADAQGREERTMRLKPPPGTVGMLAETAESGEPVYLLDWGIILPDFQKTASPEFVLLWKGAKRLLAADGEGNVLGLIDLPKRHGLREMKWWNTTLDVNNHVVWAWVSPRGTPDSKGYVGTNSGREWAARGKYPVALFMWNWQTGVARLWKMPTSFDHADWPVLNLCNDRQAPGQ